MTIITTSATSCNLFTNASSEMTRAKLLSLLIVLTINSVCAQINGEFWWLNDKLNKFRKSQPAEPEIEILGDFDTDESAKIIFRDHELFSNKLLKPNHRNKKKQLYDHSNGKIVWPHEFQKHNGKAKENMKVIKPKDPKYKVEDEFVFNFPKNEKYAINEDVSNSTNTENGTSAEVMFNDDKISIGSHNDKEAQNICTYSKKKECYQKKGVLYREWNQNEPGDEEIVCCILPIQPIHKINEPIQFPGATHNKLRNKRSEDGGLSQRNFLLLHKLSQQQQVQLGSNLNPTAKIITTAAEDDEDPYLNIKNSRFRPQINEKIVTPSYNYDTDDYGDYASELPKPGLVGLYSDHAMAPSSWTFTSNTGFAYGGIPETVPEDDYDDDDDNGANDYDTFGYSTIDPRKVTGGQKHKGKPVKFTTVSDVTLDAESHTINFHSNPDFQVLQGFKLLNLFRNRSKFRSKNSRQTTTEKIDDNTEFLGSGPEGSEEVGDEFFEEDQLFGGCGKAVAIKTKDKDKPLGDAANGSHPWAALVVLTKRRNNVLCYSTLIHPRAAITAADCVHGTSPRDITVVAGAWDLADRSRLKTRVADVTVHPRYKAGEANYNLAVLHWMRPLKLGTNIQPACLSEPHVGDDCRFYGWGSLDQGIQTRSRWQRASIRMCDPRVNKKAYQHSEVFCASVSRGHVTSLGGPLICDVGGHNSVVGIVVSMDKGHVLMPVREFGMKASELLTGD